MSVSKYPVEVSDEEGQVDAINYLLSGPAGLGQNFSGYSTYLPAYLRPTVRQPFTTPITQAPVPLYSFYSISNAEGCDENGTPTPGVLTNFVKFTFTTPFAVAPYSYGDFVSAQNVIDDYPAPPSTTYFDGSYRCWSCTTTDVILYTKSQYIYPNYISGGEVGETWINSRLSTDCNGRVTVNGGSDRVFVSGQLLCDIEYTSTVPNSEFDIIVQINRYTGYLDTNVGSTDFVFASPITTVAERTFHYNVTGNGTIDDLETVFTQFIDGPDIPFGYYWYILEFVFATTDPNGNPYPGDAKGGVVTLGLRSLTAQVVKQ